MNEAEVAVIVKAQRYVADVAKQAVAEIERLKAEVERLKERITVLNFTVRSREDEIRRLVRELNTAHSKERK